MLSRCFIIFFHSCILLSHDSLRIFVSALFILHPNIKIISPMFHINNHSRLIKPFMVIMLLIQFFILSCSSVSPDPSSDSNSDTTSFLDTLPPFYHHDSVVCLTILSPELKVLYPIKYFRDPRNVKDYYGQLTGYPDTDYKKLYGDFNGDGIVDTCFINLTAIPGKVRKDDDPFDEVYVQQTLSFSDPKIKHLIYPFNLLINLHLVGDIDGNGNDDLGILYYTGFSWADFTILSYIENEWTELFSSIESQTLYRYSGIIPYEKDTINPGYVIVRYPALIPDTVDSIPTHVCRKVFCEKVIETRISVVPPLKPNND